MREKVWQEKKSEPRFEPVRSANAPSVQCLLSRWQSIRQTFLTCLIFKIKLKNYWTSTLERRFLETISFGRHWDMSSILPYRDLHLSGWSLCPSTIRAVNKWLQATNRLGVQPPHPQPCSTMINCIGLTWPKSSSTKTDSGWLVA